MKDRIIRYLLKLLIIFIKPEWKKGNIKILINEGSQKRACEIMNKLLQEFSEYNLSICIAKSKLQFLSYIRHADIVYSYGLSKYACTENLKMLYIGQVGNIESKNSENFKIFYAPNFVFNYISDFILASIFAYERGILQNIINRKRNKWTPNRFLQRDMKYFSELKIGIIGLGKIGSQVARCLIQNQCEIHVYDTQQSRMNGYKNQYTMSNWKDMLKVVDYLVLALSNEGNRNLITTREFESANSRLCLVNISRGSIVNEEDLLKAVREKKIRGAILDVFMKEPLPDYHPFWNQEGIIVTPHIAGNINLVFDKIVSDFLCQVKKYLNGVI